MILQQDRPTRELRRVRIDPLVLRRAVERRRIVHEHAVVEHRRDGRRVKFAGRLETRRRKHDVVRLPETGLARCVDERWKLAVHRRRAAIRVGGVLIAVEHLDLERAHQIHAAVAATLAVALHDRWRRELDVQLHVSELRFRAQHAFAGREHAGLHLPGGRLPVGHRPVRQIAAAREQHRRVRRRRHHQRLGAARRHDRRLRPRGIVNVPLAVRLHRRVGVAQVVVLLRDQSGRHDDERRSQRDQRFHAREVNVPDAGPTRALPIQCVMP